MNSPYKILIIDNSENDRNAYKQFLSGSNTHSYDVIEAASGKEGLDYYSKQPPDCILLDFHLPDQTGVDFLHALKTNLLPNIPPVIILTGQDPLNAAEKATLYGVHDYLPKTQLSMEKLNYSIANAIEKAELIRTIAQQKEELVRLSNHDAITDIPNLMVFKEFAIRALAQTKRHQRQLALLYIDLDNFKNIHDTLGHHIGEQLLKEFAHFLNQCTRKEDFVGRVGEDEFTLILTEIKNDFDAGRVAQRILDKAHLFCKLDGQKVHLSISIGIACYPYANIDFDGLMECARIAVHHAKSMGKNSYQFFANTIKERYDDRLKLENSLQEAMDKQQLFLKFQPTFNLKNQSIPAIEALLRWNHPELGKIYPEEIISLAEDTLMMKELGQWVLSTACHQFSLCDENIREHCQLAINISPHQLLDTHFFQFVKDILQQTGIPPKQLMLEFTETTLIMEQPESVEAMHELKVLGVNLSIDSFGTGNSSLNQLNQLPIDAIKIDKSFIQDLAFDDKNKMFIKSMIALANNLNLKISAKEVETKKQMAFLLDNGCLFAQGYYFCKPIDMLAIEKLLTNNRS